MSSKKPSRQLEFLLSLQEACGEEIIVCDREDSFEATRTTLKDSKVLKAGKPLIGRYRTEQEVLFDFDGHLKFDEGTPLAERRAETTQAVQKRALPEARKLLLWCKENKAPIYFYDSGRGLHAQMVVANLKQEAEKAGIDSNKFGKALWKIVGRKAGLTKQDPCLMGRQQNSVIRACGGFNQNVESYKTFTQQLATKEYCDTPEDVKYPDKWVKWVLPKELIDEVVSEVHREEAIKQPINPAFKNHKGRMDLPCIRALLTTPIPETGQSTRNNLASFLAYNAMLEYGPDDPRVEEVLREYAKKCREIGDFPDQGAINWPKTIREHGLDKWEADCGLIHHYEKVLKDTGTPIRLCGSNCLLNDAPNNDLLVTHAELMLRDFAPPSWIIPGVLGRGHLGILTGFSGHAKSWLALSLAIDAASGNSFLGKYPLEKISVLYIENENGIYELRRRIEYLTKNNERLDNLHFAPYPSLDLLESTGWLETQIQQKEVRLVVLDSFAGLHTAKENEAEVMRKVLTKLKKIAMDYEVAFLLLIHPNKASNFKGSKKSFPPDYLERLRGSSEFRNVADDIIGIWMPDSEEKVFFFEPVKCRTGEIREGEVFQMLFDDDQKTLEFEFREKMKDYKLGAEKCLADIVVWASTELREDEGRFLTKDAKAAMDGRWGKTTVSDALKLVREGKCDQIKFFSRGKYQLKSLDREVREVRTDKTDNSRQKDQNDCAGSVRAHAPLGTLPSAFGTSKNLVREVREYIVADNFVLEQSFDVATVAQAINLAEKDVLAALQILSKDGVVSEVSPGMWRLSKSARLSGEEAGGVL